MKNQTEDINLIQRPTNRIIKRIIKSRNREISLPDPWLRILEWQFSVEMTPSDSDVTQSFYLSRSISENSSKSTSSIVKEIISSSSETSSSICELNIEPIKTQGRHP